jgi:hypothetical protein
MAVVVVNTSPLLNNTIEPDGADVRNVFTLDTVCQGVDGLVPLLRSLPVEET